LLGEEVVEEWLNRDGHFTIRGIRLGVHEIDLLAIKPRRNGGHDCRHLEVQVSTNPIAYISKVPRQLQRDRGIGPDNAKTRPDAELKLGIAEWIAKKFEHPKKARLRERLCPGDWSYELVVNQVRHPEELELFKKAGVTVWRLKDIVEQMGKKSPIITAAAGGDLFTLMQLGREQAEPRFKPTRPR
jgi:hypothetical protein